MGQKNSKLWIWILIVIAVILLAGMGAYYWYFIKNKTVPSATISPSPSATASSETVTDPGVTWVSPQVIGDLKLIKTGADTTGISSVIYYKIATLDDGGELILAKLEFDGPSVPVYYRFKKSADGKYTYLMKLSTEKDKGVLATSLGEGVIIDETTTYKSLDAPAVITLKNIQFKSSSNIGLFSDLEDKDKYPAPLKEIGQTSYGKFYQRITEIPKADTGGMIFAQKLADSTYRDYTLKFNFLTDDEVAQITWKDGTKNMAKYTSESYVGCAMTTSDNVIVNKENIADRLTEAGKTKEGDIVYTVSKDDPITKMAYDNYQLGREQVDSLKEFSAKKPVFIWKDPLGDYIVLTGRDFKGMAECAKPVIYLYPTASQNVSVKVGANITKSEPIYQNGWEVFAWPSGKLKVAGKFYDSLFWDGRGLGEYPMIQAGFILKNEDLKSTIEKQLGELGLNGREIADFTDFWLAKMPNTPYVRLTWLGTQDMNKLAPLSISPSPDTLIRVFLDFEGLNEPINIRAQKLSAPVRHGFTVIEWGGLLR